MKHKLLVLPLLIIGLLAGLVGCDLLSTAGCIDRGSFPGGCKRFV